MERDDQEGAQVQKNHMNDMKNKFWIYHKEIKASLKEKELL